MIYYILLYLLYYIYIISRLIVYTLTPAGCVWLTQERRDLAAAAGTTGHQLLARGYRSPAPVPQWQVQPSTYTPASIGDAWSRMWFSNLWSSLYCSSFWMSVFYEWISTDSAKEICRNNNSSPWFYSEPDNVSFSDHEYTNNICNESIIIVQINKIIFSLSSLHPLSVMKGFSFLEFCSKMRPFAQNWLNLFNFLFYWKNSWKLPRFGKWLHFRAKCKKGDPTWN